jgi:hypothetical protein
VAAVTAPGSGRSLFGKVSSAMSALQARKRGRPGAAAVVAAKVREHVLTVAALASADLGAFHWGSGVGWLVTGASLLALDFAVRG